MPKVLVIIVTYNARKWIRQCLSSIDIQKYDTLVVDNHSADDTIHLIHSEFPDVMLSIQSQNLGFGKANNIGLQKAMDEDYDYVLLLNQDAWVLPNTIDDLMAAHGSNPQYGVLSPMQYHSMTNDIERQFAIYVKRYKVDVFSKDIEPVEFANAAIWLISKQCIARVGGFDPLFPHYGEDTDYLQRVHHKGYKVGIVPKIIAYHDRESTTTSNIKKDIYKATLVYIGYIKDITHSWIVGYFKCFQLFLRKLIKAIYTMDMTLLRINIAAMRAVFKQMHQVREHRKLSLKERAFLK